MNMPLRAHDPNEVLPGLLASQCGSKDEPRLHLGPIPLDVFRLLPKWNNNRHFVFVMALHYASGERRTKAGHKGLMVEAARTILRLHMPEVCRIYRERGAFLHLSDAMLTDVARAYAAEMTLDPELKREVINALALNRRIMSNNPAIAALGAMFTEYHEAQSPISTLNMWQDYVELLLAHSPNTVAFNLRRWIYCCLRVHGAVFMP